MQHTSASPNRLSERDGVTQICEQVAREIGNMLLSDVKHLADDLRQQYRDHNRLLAQQELVVQQLVIQIQSISGQHLRKLTTPPRNGIAKKSPWSLGAPLCTEPESTMSEDGNFFDTHGNVRAMSPRPSPAPPVPHPNPHPSPENTYDDVLTPVILAEAPVLTPAIIEEAPVLTPPEREKEESNLVSTHDRSRTGSTVVKFSTADITPCLGDTDPERFDSSGEIDNWDGKLPTFEAHINSAPEVWNTGAAKIEKGVTRSSFSAHPARGSVRARGGNMFGNYLPDDKALDQEDYTVFALYWDTGISQMIARSDFFANITLFVIGANAIYIGIDADRNNEDNLLDADTVFLVCENIFCTFFTFEWLVRFFSFRRKRDSIGDLWFVFDTCLVTMMVIETWILPFLFSGGTGIPTGLVKMLRLLRLARMARVMRAFPDLMAMIKGVGVASRAVGSALLMLILLVYVFAIMMFTLLKDTQNDQIQERFNRLGLVMWTLLIDGAFMDGIGYISRAMIDDNEYVAIFVLLMFVLCSALTVMNMLIGVLCQVVSAVAMKEKEESAIRTVKSELLSMLKEMDEDCSGLISRDEMASVFKNKQALDTLESLYVDVDILMAFLDMKFEDLGELKIHDIMDLILMLRGERSPTIKDLLEAMAFNRWQITNKHIADSTNAVRNHSEWQQSEWPVGSSEHSCSRNVSAASISVSLPLPAGSGVKQSIHTRSSRQQRI